MSDKTNYAAPSFPVLLTLVFITLKLTGHIGWSWIWILAPIWIPIGLAGLLVIIFQLLEVE